MREELQMCSLISPYQAYGAEEMATEPGRLGFTFTCRVPGEIKNQMRRGMLYMPVSEAATYSLRNIENTHVILIATRL